MLVFRTERDNHQEPLILSCYLVGERREDDGRELGGSGKARICWQMGKLVKRCMQAGPRQNEEAKRKKLTSKTGTAQIIQGWTGPQVAHFKTRRRVVGSSQTGVLRQEQSQNQKGAKGEDPVSPAEGRWRPGDPLRKGGAGTELVSKRPEQPGRHPACPGSQGFSPLTRGLQAGTARASGWEPIFERVTVSQRELAQAPADADAHRRGQLPTTVPP